MHTRDFIFAFLVYSCIDWDVSSVDINGTDV